MKPTDEQIKEFWEWCGWSIYQDIGRWHSIRPDGTRYMGTTDEKFLPLLFEPLDLNNLFKYAVPKLFEMGYWIKTSHQHSMYDVVDSHSAEVGQHKFTGGGKFSCQENPALALFWAIWEVIKDDKT